MNGFPCEGIMWTGPRMVWGPGFTCKYNLVVAGHDKQGFVFEIPVIGAVAVGVIMLLKVDPFPAGGDFF